MKTLPEIELNQQQAESKDRIRDILKAKADVIVDRIAGKLASKSDAELFGQTEFEIRDLVHQLGAESLDIAVEDRKKTDTRAVVSSVPNARATADSIRTDPAK